MLDHMQPKAFLFPLHFHSPRLFGHHMIDRLGKERDLQVYKCHLCLACVGVDANWSGFFDLHEHVLLFCGLHSVFALWASGPKISDLVRCVV